MVNIPIFLISDEKYAMYMTCTITSIVANTKSFIDFYILDGGITDFTKEKINKLKEQFNNFSLEFIKIDKKIFEKFPDIGHFSLNMYFRYLIPSLKPKILKALYIDSDMIITGDIQELYDEDLGNYSLGAVPYIHENIKYKRTSEYRWTQRLKEKLEIDNAHLYFNSGILLLDLEKFRKNNIQERLFETTAKYSSKLECPDQDVLNKIFEKNYKVLDEKYNVIVDVTAHLATEKLKNTFIIHYTGQKHRPWLRSGCFLQDSFWLYAKQTTFYDDLRWQLLFKELEHTNNLINFNRNRTKYLFNKFVAKIIPVKR